MLTIVLIGLAASAVIGLKIKRRRSRQKLLPPAPKTHANTDFERRLEAQGILKARMESDEDAGAPQWGTVYMDGKRESRIADILRQDDPADLGRIFFSWHQRCGYCRTGSVYLAVAITLRPVPAGATDLGLRELRKALSCCEGCGWLATEHGVLLPADLHRERNIHRWLEMRERGSVPGFSSARLSALHVEHQRLERRLAAVKAEIAAESARLAIGAPYRAGLLDPPDDQAKELPALIAP